MEKAKGDQIKLHNRKLHRHNSLNIIIPNFLYRPFKHEIICNMFKWELMMHTSQWRRSAICTNLNYSWFVQANLPAKKYGVVGQRLSALLVGVNMSKERGQQSRERFQCWVSEMKAKEPPNWLDYWHGDTLSPKKIAGELGFDSSAFKKSRNERLHQMLEDLKQELAESGIYHKRISRLKLDGDVVDINKSSNDDIKDSAKVRDLKITNRRLQAENARLSAEVAKLSEFKEVLINMGLWK